MNGASRTGRKTGVPTPLNSSLCSLSRAEHPGAIRIERQCNENTNDMTDEPAFKIGVLQLSMEPLDETCRMLRPARRRV